MQGGVGEPELSPRLSRQLTWKGVGGAGGGGRPRPRGWRRGLARGPPRASGTAALGNNEVRVGAARGGARKGGAGGGLGVKGGGIIVWVRER